MWTRTSLVSWVCTWNKSEMGGEPAGRREEQRLQSDRLPAWAIRAGLW